VNPEAAQDRAEDRESAGAFARLGLALADWSEQWFPDAFVFALVALILIFFAGLSVGTGMRNLVQYFGVGFWSLIPFTMYTAMSIIGGYVVATSPPVHGLIRRLSRIPRTARGAVAFVAFFSMATALFSYGLSVIFSSILARETVRNVRGIDYRAIGAASYLGTGTVWGLGISSSASLLMATPSALPASLINVSGVIPLRQTTFTWQSLTTLAILMCSSVVVAYLSAPKTSTKTAESFGVTTGLDLGKLGERNTPAEWLEYAPVLSIVVGLLGLAYIGQVLAARGPLAAFNLATYNLTFLMAGLLMHWRPRSFTRAVNNAVPATAGVLIQFPFYGAIFGILTMSPIAEKMSRTFVHISTHGTYPLLITIYSGIVGMFVPSGGSKWIIEAPYVLQAAKDLHVNLGWVVQIYNAAEALPNLVNPFYMLPILGILKVRARDLVGYGLVQLMVNTVWVLFLTWFLARTFA
jgi:short-chain fatty acids transporter